MKWRKTRRKHSRKGVRGRRRRRKKSNGRNRRTRERRKRNRRTKLRKRRKRMSIREHEYKENEDFERTERGKDAMRRRGEERGIREEERD